MSNHQQIINQVCADMPIDKIRQLVLLFEEDNVFQNAFLSKLGSLTREQQLDALANTKHMLRQKLNTLALQQWKQDNYSRMSDLIQTMPISWVRNYFVHILNPNMNVLHTRAKMAKIITDDGLITDEYERACSAQQFKQIIKNYLYHSNEF